MGKKKAKTIKPRVSLCTPTFNRRPFIAQMVDNIMKQDYPKESMEWIIVDDGTDPIGDLVKHIPFVKYIYSEERMSLGKKRNFMHQQCTFTDDNDIVVYIDDDDYYPPCRVSHAVETLMKSPALCAGASEIYLWFNGINKMYKFGPYGPRHGTAGTFAFKRVLLKRHPIRRQRGFSRGKIFSKKLHRSIRSVKPLENHFGYFARTKYV